MTSPARTADAASGGEGGAEKARPFALGSRDLLGIAAIESVAAGAPTGASADTALAGAALLVAGAAGVRPY